MSNVRFVAEAIEKKLKKAHVSTARLDCLILLEDVTKKDRGWLLAHGEHELSEEQVEALNKQVERRARHEPLAYIRGKSAFYDREFFVNEHTLQPRPETETMIELLLDLAKSSKLKALSVIDVGTGSGCIAITIELELPKSTVIATDISEPCLRVAKKNAKQLGADVSFMQTNLVSDLKPREIDQAILCCNLPYVPADFTINQAAMFEPEIAIFGGKDGLDYYRQLFDQLKEKRVTPQAILTESLPTQHKALKKLVESYGYKLEKAQDFIQLFVPNS